ncbi:hypothetical protein EVAR_48966_1 [Eumeta japonica]|uniref:Uncharacterized protein n=1 Tax=Eumeta variegata TaxID=151549 RepID=A0A4C1Y4W3_EUMVA|nr:hypothetical protein EVAR_48966_1 [Eumeta japonica]
MSQKRSARMAAARAAPCLSANVSRVIYVVVGLCAYTDVKNKQAMGHDGIRLYCSQAYFTPLLTSTIVTTLLRKLQPKPQTGGKASRAIAAACVDLASKYD